MTLPVGLDLTGRRALVVGGAPTVVGAARALVRAGARLDVVSPWLCEELEELALSGELTWAARDYAGVTDLDDAWFVVVGSGDSAVDEAVRADALAARVWCVDAAAPAGSGGRRGGSRGTADLPTTSQVTTRDGTVTLAAHSPGDPALAATTARAVDALLAEGALDLRRRTARPGTGWVALVGGGPGADGLLTTRARELIASADVVVVDRLAPRAVVDRLPATVRVVDVGKAPGRHALAQDAINDLLVEEALAGRAVVRLKGGDPYVLGRGGEERLACEAHGIRGRGGARRDERGRGAGRGRHPGHPPRRRARLHRRHRPRRAARGAARHRPHGGAADGRRPAGALDPLTAGCRPPGVVPGGRHRARVRARPAGHLRHPGATSPARAAAAGVENPAVVVVGDVVRLSPDHPG